MKAIDIHCHSVMTHFRNHPHYPSACSEIRSKVGGLLGFFDNHESMRSEITQSDYSKLAKGNVSAIWISLYPIERKWLFPRTGLMPMKSSKIRHATGFSMANVKMMSRDLRRNLPIPYYRELVGEYQYVLNNQSNCGGKVAKIVSSFDEMNSLEDDHISVVISIEGGHSLAHNLPKQYLHKDPDHCSATDYNEYYRKQVFAVKKWGPKGQEGSHAPLYITLSHHYWNMLSGHCESLPPLFAQPVGKNYGFTEAGKIMVQDLISDEDEHGKPNQLRRILIDTKHMSPRARKEYYQIVEQKRREGLSIPIICSHASIGEAENLDDYINNDLDTIVTNFDYFNSGSLSLCKEDLIATRESDGLVGIILHEKRLTNKIALSDEGYGIDGFRKQRRLLKSNIISLQRRRPWRRKKREEIQRRIQQKRSELAKVEQEMREAYINLIMANIYNAVEKMNDGVSSEDRKHAWNRICIGSDFDGTINKLDMFGTAADFPKMAEEMQKYMEQPRPLAKFKPTWDTNYLKGLQYGISAKELAAKIMHGNVELFMKKYFHDDYLKQGKIRQV